MKAYLATEAKLIRMCNVMWNLGRCVGGSWRNSRRYFLQSRVALHSICKVWRETSTFDATQPVTKRVNIRRVGVQRSTLEASFLTSTHTSTHAVITEGGIFDATVWQFEIAKIMPKLAPNRVSIALSASAYHTIQVKLTQLFWQNLDKFKNTSSCTWNLRRCTQ